MNPFQALRRPLAFAEQCLGLALLGGIWFWWLDLAESTTGRLIISGLTVTAIAAGVWLLARRGRARFASPENQAAGGAGQAIAAALLLAMSIAAAYWLVWWVPAIDSLTGQVVSIVLRFGAAFLLVALFWSNLLASAAAARKAQQ